MYVGNCTFNYSHHLLFPGLPFPPEPMPLLSGDPRAFRIGGAAGPRTLTLIPFLKGDPNPPRRGGADDWDV